jgi:glycosyltransferase involved in cell wall biosynthesis
MTVRDEADHLARVVEQVLAQDYPGPFEVVAAVGPSRDQTRAIAEDLASRHPTLRLIDNPSGGIPQGLNLAWRATKHDYLVRVDGHALLPPGYVRKAVELLDQTGAANVGGMMVPEGVGPFQKAVARAMSSPFGIGRVQFHTGGGPGPADTVYLGNFRRSDLEEVGGYDEALGRAEDWDLNHRLAQAGKLVWFDPTLGVLYRPRDNWRALVRQFFSTGRWRWQVVRHDPKTASPRYLAAPGATLAVGTGLIIGLAGLAKLAGAGARTDRGQRKALRRRNSRRTDRIWVAALGLPALYAAGVTAAAAVSAGGLDGRAKRRLPLAIATMHLAWGSGFLRGMFDQPTRRPSADGDPSEVRGPRP